MNKDASILEQVGVDEQLQGAMRKNLWRQTKNVAEQSIATVSIDKRKVHQSC